MNENEIYKGVAETFTDKPYKMVVPIRWLPTEPEIEPIKRTLLDKILMRPISPLPVSQDPELYREITIYPCVVANMYRIAASATKLPNEIIEGSPANVIIPLITEHLPTIVYIIASAIQNNHLEPEQDLILFIERNFTQDMILVALDEAIEGLGLNSFLNSIVLARGTVGILKPKTSPKDGSELIASHTEQ